MSVRVRFAPSPTGGLHLGGVRTVLFNYLFAKKHNGSFIVRIEDTDQNRFVEGAEKYIFDCLDWCNLNPDESTLNGGPYAPYRQSERKKIYLEYALKLIESGHAYYAFDTPEELEQMRNANKTDSYTNPQYDHHTRHKMRNSLSMAEVDVKSALQNGTPYVIRIKMPDTQNLILNDMIRGEITFDCSMVDDKVLLKADGMPTYHLAVVVDDYLMKITHAFRGEEWLPSAPVHLLLWEYLGWKENMPQWAHLPLILKPDGNGKLSKRDGDRLGFPVFAMNWKDNKTGETTKGFREIGFLPQAFVNMLALLGWNDGTGKELFSMEELIEKFSMDRVHKGGAKFDYEKAKWFNHQYIQNTADHNLLPLIKPIFAVQGIEVNDAKLLSLIPLIKERCTLLPDFWEQGHFFFVAPKSIDWTTIKDKWSVEKVAFFNLLIDKFASLSDVNHKELELIFNETALTSTSKKGELLLLLRIMLVGGKFGPSVFSICEFIGIKETACRINHVLKAI